MTFACYARWARCRAAHLSPWARQMNMAAFDGPRRGLAAVPALKVACAEVRPALAFPEQTLVQGCVSAMLGAAEESIDGDSLEQLLDLARSSPSSFFLLSEVIGMSASYSNPFSTQQMRHNFD
eukprot:CAMPEP_0115210456 /NCGR_PEP_ID=MMETSP0270-20121206/22258_1 /TAXON_ID=71861 /ORGANISM="Scrippsiella trochoidea, Strain CCMP3099" /LENGTH=122 /DNA_ID=CAMNT_0002624115 /DNA_START=124 /DNA_END=492 /DNA_ORIENTATION=-